MDYLEKNFETLKTVRPFFFEKVKSKYDEGYSEEGIEELDTRDGHKALCIERNGEKVRLNSLFRPLQEAEKWADQYEYQNLSVPVFMFGVGNGIFLRELLAGIGQRTGEILDTIYEKSYSGYLALAGAEEDGRLRHMPAKIRDRNTILVNHSVPWGKPCAKQDSRRAVQNIKANGEAGLSGKYHRTIYGTRLYTFLLSHVLLWH